MKKRQFELIPEKWVKVLLWVLIAIYTYLLPEARRVYNAIVAMFGQETAGKVPLVLVVIGGMAYTAAVLRTQRSIKGLMFLIPAGMIAMLIMRLVENPNKHIHIPQYVLMTWLLFAVLSRDVRRKDVLALVFLYASVLGVVDELEQGVHPARFYGWSDMVVNSASSLIGVFTIMGLKPLPAAEWGWAGRLRDMRELLSVIALGVAGTALMCVFLFEVQASEDFWGVYPHWLMVWHVFFLIAAPGALVHSLRKMRRNEQISVETAGEALPGGQRTAFLWTLPMLSILFYMHSILIYVAVCGMAFK